MRRKRMLAKLVACAIMVGMAKCPVAAEEAAVDAKSAVLMEPRTGTVLLEKNAHESLPPASVTKVMTILLVYDALAEGRLKAEDVVTISEHASSMGGSQVFLEPGEEQTVATLLKCVVVASANDGAVALAERVSGSEEAFVADMNQRAKALGMNDTTFKNACGLDADGHVTSAYDIALMTRELMTKYPQVFELTKIWQDTIVHTTRRGSEEFGLTNTNKLLKMYPDATGMKTGSTGAALFCLSATAERDGLQLVSAIMGAPTAKIRFEESIKMLDYGFAYYAVTVGDAAGTKKGDIPVDKGAKDTVAAVVQTEVSVLTQKGEAAALETQLTLDEFVKAPVAAGTAVGEIVYTYQGKPVGKSALVAEEAVERLNFSGMVRRLMQGWVTAQ